MLKKKSNKAVEPIVGTVLLLLITISAATIIFGVIVPFIQNKLIEGGGSSCMTARLVIDTKSGYTCYDGSNRVVNVVVSRGSEDFELAGLQIIVAVDGATEAFNINQSLPEKNEQRLFMVNLTTSNPAATAKEVGVAPIAKMGNIQQLCGITSAAKLNRCT